MLIQSTNAIAQESSCQELLEDGLYSFTQMTKTESFAKDLKNYYSSEQFKSDMRSNKWGLSLTIPIQGVPFSIGANDSDERFSELKTKLSAISELRIEQSSVQILLQSIPNTNLYEAYLECMRINSSNNLFGFVQGKNIETNEFVVFTIYYRPSSRRDKAPVVSGFSVVPEGSVVSGGLKVGQTLSNFTTLVTCKRPLDKDLILTLETDRGAFASKVSALEKESDIKVPIGAIIASVLDYNSFLDINKDSQRNFDIKRSTWAPCDGRSVVGSKYGSKLAQVPDLRGVFLRGINDMNVPGSQPVATERINPENKVAGEYQNDELKEHTHTFRTGGGSSGPRHAVSIDTRNEDATTTSSYGGKETRPKNVTVYYYIRIN